MADKVKAVDAYRAACWYQEHRLHVMALMNTEDRHYPPSGSDKAHPELWKPAHWRWFFLTEFFIEKLKKALSDV